MSAMDVSGLITGSRRIALGRLAPAVAQWRRAQGKSNREIKRCLVRYVARQLLRLLEHQAGSRLVV